MVWAGFFMFYGMGLPKTQYLKLDRANDIIQRALQIGPLTKAMLEDGWTMSKDAKKREKDDAAHYNHKRRREAKEDEKLAQQEIDARGPAAMAKLTT